jgi:hypothetical protein
VLVGITSAIALVAGVVPRFDDLAVPCTGSSCAPQQLTVEESGRFADAGIDLSTYAALVTGLELVAVLVWFVLAALIVRSSRSSVVTALAAVMMLTFGVTVSGFPDALDDRGPVWQMVAGGLNWMGLVSIVLFLFMFPDGRIVPGRARAMVPVVPVAFAVILAYPNGQLDPKTSLVGVTVMLLLLGAAFTAQVHRYRTVSGPVERQQTRWVVAGAAGFVLGFAAVIAFDAVNQQALGFNVGLYIAEISAFNLIKLLLPASIAVAILRYRLWDIDTLVNRALVYALLSASVVGVYIAVVGYLGALFQTDSNLPVSLVATGIVAVGFQPLRERLQRGVNRVMFGERDDPYTVISRLGERLEGALEPDLVPAMIVTTIRDALRLPFAAITTERDGLSVEAASAGERVENVLKLPLLHHGETVGHLVVGARAADTSWSTADVRLLSQLARHAGAAIRSLQLMEDLQRSRERLVLSREEERR